MPAGKPALWRQQPKLYLVDLHYNTICKNGKGWEVVLQQPKRGTAYLARKFPPPPNRENFGKQPRAGTVFQLQLGELRPQLFVFPFVFCRQSIPRFRQGPDVIDVILHLKKEEEEEEGPATEFPNSREGRCLIS